MGKREGYGFSFAKIGTDWKVGLLFCYTLISGCRKGAAMSKFLSYEDRLIIAKCLQENASFGEISKELGKDRTTIAKEIKKYSYDKKTGRPGYPYNPCRFRVSCKAKKICGNACSHQSAYKCSLCSECSLHCPDFIYLSIISSDRFINLTSVQTLFLINSLVLMFIKTNPE